LLRIDEVAEQTGYRAHEGDYETIGGVIMDALGHIPAEGESVDLTAFEPDVLDAPPVWRATVAKMDGRRIDLLDLVRVTPPTKDGGRN
jgi:CBS domain containing-hemolysin-like protein